MAKQRRSSARSSAATRGAPATSTPRTPTSSGTASTASKRSSPSWAPAAFPSARTTTEGTDHATGVWADGRIGTFRGIRKGTPRLRRHRVRHQGRRLGTGAFDGYQPLLVEVGKFFKTGKPPITPEQTIEILAFMEAADESKKDGGKPVTIQSVMEKARAQVSASK